MKYILNLLFTVDSPFLPQGKPFLCTHRTQISPSSTDPGKSQMFPVRVLPGDAPLDVLVNFHAHNIPQRPTKGLKDVHSLLCFADV